MMDLGTCRILVMSIAFMFLMINFQIIVYIMVLIEGLRFEENHFTGLGSLCLILIYVISGLTVLMVPWLISITGPKLTMLFGCATHILFVMSMIQPHPMCTCFASALVGFGSALLWVSQGNYLVRNSTDRTVSSNCALYWIFWQISALFGSIFIYFRFLDVSTIYNSFRMSIIWLLLGLSCTSFLFYLLLPNCTRDDDLSKYKQGIFQVTFGIGKLLHNGHTLVLGIPCFVIGTNVIFLTVVYVVSIGHTMHLERPKQLAPLAGVFIGLGEVIGGGVFLAFGSCGGRSSRNAIVIFGCVIIILALILIMLNLPNEAPFGDTDDLAFIETSAVLVIGPSFLLGLADSCFNTQIMTTLALKYPNNSASVFSVLNFFRVFGILIAIIYSAFLILYGVIVLLIALSLFSTIAYIVSETMDVEEDEIFNHTQKDKNVPIEDDNSESDKPSPSASLSPPSIIMPPSRGASGSKLESPISAQGDSKLKLDDQDIGTPDFVEPQRPLRGLLRRLLMGPQDYEDEEVQPSRPPTPTLEPLPTIPPVESTTPSTTPLSLTPPRPHKIQASASRHLARTVDIASEGPKEVLDSPTPLASPAKKAPKERKSAIKRMVSGPEQLPAEDKDEELTPKMKENQQFKKRRRSTKAKTIAADQDDKVSNVIPVKSQKSVEPPKSADREKTTRKGNIRKRTERRPASSISRKNLRAQQD
ncbi:UNC93-like protein MFSD11 [Harmonia axyridis]|uniref:UNC93-like protein MFSD11 n=1 Tax=Harmonia axyridis TaxID=115357 RepID=UPI001E278D1C|nr:UNC93-like protein MFSD11 [Harmonia axyridis]